MSQVFNTGQAVYNVATAKRILDSVAEREIDFVGFGDSNQSYNGTGWDHGLQHGFATLGQFPMYATAMNAVQPSLGVGYKFAAALDSNWTNGTYGSNSGADSAHSAFMPSFNSDIYSYINVATAYARDGWVNNAGLTIDVNCPLNISHNLRGYLWYGTFTGTGDGLVTLSWRQQGGANANLGSKLDINTEGAASTTVVSTFLDLAAADRSSYTGLKLRFLHQDSGDQLRGKAWLGYQRVHDLDVKKGWSYTSWWAFAGSSLYDLLLAFQSGEASSTTYQRWRIQQIVDLQARPKKIVFTICFGLNDRNEIELSLGPTGGILSSTQNGYKDNLLGIINLLKSTWVASGYNLKDCYFLLLPSHPYSSGTSGNYPVDSQLELYHHACREIAANDGQCVYVNMRALTNIQHMVTYGWYDGGGEPQAHLSIKGYESLGILIINALYQAASGYKTSSMNIPTISNIG